MALRIGKAIRADLSGQLQFTAEVQAKSRIPVIPRVTAQLDQIPVEVGSRVREGDVLAELNRSEFEVRVLEAQAAQAGAEARLSALKGKARPEAVAQAQANLKAAQARLQSLENARASADPAALQARADGARARLSRAEAQAQTQAQISPQTVAQADSNVSVAQNKLNQLLQDPARANDRGALELARDELKRAQDAAAAARQPNTSAAPALESARREVQDADQALAIARLSVNAFDLDQARALVEAADAQVKLLTSPASADEIKAAEASVEQAFAQAELARMRLRDATVTAPITGIVVEVSGAPGSTVGPTAPILTLMPPELQAVVQADETQAAQLAAGQAATFSIESLPQDTFNGVVKAVAPVLDPRTRTVAVKIEVPDPRGRLRPGMFAQVSIQTAPRQLAVLVPRESVQRAPATDAGQVSQSTVWAVVDNRVRRQRVITGSADQRNIEILQGLTEGIDVVLNPRSDLVDGEQIITTP